MNKSTQNERQVEHHPLPPFLPSHARVLMLGSFPPPQSRWSMDFFYPNLQNDMWRIMGVVFYGNKNEFICEQSKLFDKQKIIDFLNEKGIALYDTAYSVVRLKGNASDASLEVVEPTDIAQLLHQLPKCDTIVTTGEKATNTIIENYPMEKPIIGGSSAFKFEMRDMRLYRMPSSSRAYPLKLEKKAEAYRIMFEALGLLH